MLKVGKSFLSLIVVVLLTIIPVRMASAHSVLEKAIPTDGAQLTDTIKSIELTFNTKVENGSTLYLVNDAEEEIQPMSVELADNVLEAIFQDSLEPGSYQVNWKIVGEDGHPIESQYSFTIKEPEIKQPEDNTTGTEDEQTNSPSVTEDSQNEEEKEAGLNNQEIEKQNSSKQQTTNESDQSSVGSGIIIFLIVAGLGLLALLFSKRKK